MRKKLIAGLACIFSVCVVTPVSAQIISSPDNRSNWFLNYSHATWDAGPVQAAAALQNSVLYNAAVLQEIPFFSTPLILRQSGLSETTKADRWSTGFSFGSAGGTGRGNLSLTYLDAGGRSGYSSQVLLENGTSLIGGGEFSIDRRDIVLEEQDELRRYELQYDHEIYIIRGGATFLDGLGIRLGANISHDLSSSRRFSVPVFNQVTASNQGDFVDILEAIISTPIPTNTDYSAYTGTGLIGLVYRVGLFDGQEADVSLNYYQGYAQGKLMTQELVTNPQYGIPLLSSVGYRFNEAVVEGNEFTGGYTFTYANQALRLFYTKKSISYAMSDIEAEGINALIEPIGPNPNYRETIESFGIEYSIRF